MYYRLANNVILSNNLINKPDTHLSVQM